MSADGQQFIHKLSSVEMDKKQKLLEACRNYIADVLIFTLVIVLIMLAPWYTAYISESARKALVYLYFTFLILGIPYYYFVAGDSINRARRIISGLVGYIHLIVQYPWEYLRSRKQPFPILDQETKVSMLFLLVKFFYLPIMISFTFNHITDIKYLWNDFTINGIGTLTNLLMNNFIYVTIINILYFIDTAYFSFGYLVETSRLKNEVRSVEPTLLGWAVALACYPPFSDYVGAMYNWTKSDMVVFEDSLTTTLFRMVIIIFTATYVWATLALGAKCSNLTNRGIVARGPYAIVRHPAYIAKNMIWWIMTIPFMNNPTAIGAGIVWSFIYYLRAMTEERHLMTDPDYQEYCAKVRWRFIPFVY